MSTVAEIQSAIARLDLSEKRKVLDFLCTTLEAECSGEVFPDLKGLLLEIPPFGTDEDFARIREMPRDLGLS